jgi:hypothetical protein
MLFQLCKIQYSFNFLRCGLPVLNLRCLVAVAHVIAERARCLFWVSFWVTIICPCFLEAQDFSGRQMLFESDNGSFMTRQRFFEDGINFRSGPVGRLSTCQFRDEGVSERLSGIVESFDFSLFFTSSDCKSVVDERGNKESKQGASDKTTEVKLQSFLLGVLFGLFVWQCVYAR